MDHRAMSTYTYVKQEQVAPRHSLIQPTFLQSKKGYVDISDFV